MAPDLAAIVDDARVGAVAHDAAAEGMRGEQATERPLPEQASQVVAAKAGAELLEAFLHLLEHLHARIGIPVEVDVAVSIELEDTVSRVAAHAEEGKEMLGPVAREQV